MADPDTTGWRSIDTWIPADCSVLVTDGVEVWKAERDGEWPREDQWCGEPKFWMPLPKPRKSAREENQHMADNHTMITTRRLHNMWLDGYQRAVAVMREWADEFGDEQCKQTVLVCADMIEAAKPTPEMIEDATFGDQHDQ